LKTHPVYSEMIMIIRAIYSSSRDPLPPAA
jgi:hypothetical protein